MAHAREVVSDATARLYADSGRPLKSWNWTISVWANVSRRSAHNVVHMHPGVTWSGVYYVDDGEPDHGTPGASLELFDPNPARTSLFFPDLTATFLTFKPQPGTMLLFSKLYASRCPSP